MANGDTKTNQYLDIAANGTRSDFPASCCETRSQTLIREVGERIMDVEDEVERLENNPDVADIVATYADLQAYDTTQLTDKDVIRVLQDETHDGDSTYYRWSTSTNTWTYIGESKQYTDFVGTDGTAAGAAGLVPAPATTDAGKFLKSDGTWDTAGSVINVVQTTGASITDVMSQNAVTGMVFSDPGTQRRVRIGNTGASNTDSVSIGGSAGASGYESTAIGKGARANGSGTLALGASATATQTGAISFPYCNDGGATGVVNFGPYNTSFGYNSSKYRLLTGLYDGQSAHDAATKGQLDSIAIQNAGAPTTATVGTVGQLLEDTTNGKLYICTDATNPYVWEEVGAGGGGGGGEGEAKVLTSADYNWNSVAEDDVTTPFDSIALWLLPAGQYTFGSDDVWRHHTIFGKENYVMNFNQRIQSAMAGGFVITHNAVFDTRRVYVPSEGSADMILGLESENRWYNYGLNSNGDATVNTSAQAATVYQITPIQAAGAPDTNTGADFVGKIYIDTTNADAYMCVAMDNTIPSYTWKKITA